MNRREFISCLTGSAAFVAGCTTSGESEPTMSSAVEIADPRCDDTDNRAAIGRNSDGVIGIDGVIENVSEGRGLTSSLYWSSAERSVICKIRTIDSDDDTAPCSGSVTYSVEIEYENVEITEIIVLHYTADEREWAETISVERSAPDS